MIFSPQLASSACTKWKLCHLEREKKKIHGFQEKGSFIMERQMQILLFYKTKLFLIGSANKGKLWYILVHILPVFSAGGGMSDRRHYPTETKRHQDCLCFSGSVCVYWRREGEKICENLKQFSSSHSLTAFTWNGNCIARCAHFIVLYPIVCL